MSEQDQPYAWFLVSFQRNANSLAMRYGAPVYLVGSALRKEQPRDLDIRIILSDADFERLYGRHDEDVDRLVEWDTQQWKRAFDCLKQSRVMSRRFRRNIDVQIQTEDEAKKYKDLPRVRLDKAPESFFEAGLTDS